MRDKKSNINVPIIGMSRSKALHLQESNAYTFMLNGQTSDENGNEVVVSNEHSNILANKFKDGYKVVGVKVDRVTNKTYFFLLNCETGCSEIGYIENETIIEDDVDTYGTSDCNGCDIVSTLKEPLEEQTQVPHQTYNTLLEDCCNNCLNLDINNPIRNIEIKTENLGQVMYFTDGINPPRYLELDYIEQYTEDGVSTCDEDLEDTCLDCEKLRIFPLYKNPKVVDYNRVLGGSLKEGVYEHFFAYSDVLGNELSNYIRLTLPVTIFNSEDIIQSINDNNEETNFAITINLKGVDQSFEYYKIVSIYKNSRTTTETVGSNYEVGIYPTSSNNFINDRNGIGGITLNQLTSKRRSIETWDGLTSANNVLFGYGVKEKEQVNLQPIFNLLGLGIKWQSTLAKEDLYSNADSNRYKGYNRDEVVPLGIRPISCDGYEYPIYPLIARPPNTLDLTEPNNTDTESITDIVDNCDLNERKYHWQYYNNSSVTESTCTNEDVQTITVVEERTEYTKALLPDITTSEIEIEIGDLESYTNLKEYLEQNINNCNIVTISGPDVCDLIDLSNLTSYQELPENKPECEDFTTPETEEIKIEEVVNEQTTLIPIPLEDYPEIDRAQTCTAFNNEIDTEFSYEYNVKYTQSGLTYNAEATTRERLNTTNTSCGSATNLITVDNSTINTTNFPSYHIEYDGETVVNNLLQTSKPHPLSQGALVNEGDYAFFNSLHDNGVWFKTSVNDRECFYIEISKQSDCNNTEFNGVSEVRVSIYDKCSSDTNTPLYTSIVDTNTHTFIEVTPAMIATLTTNDVYVLVEAPIMQTVGYGSNWETLITIDDEDETSATSFVEPNQTSYVIAPNCCFTIIDREKEYEKAIVTFDSITYCKLQKWTTSCEVEVPKIADCEPVPYQRGELAYYESSEKYPCNQELYDSTDLIIAPEDILDDDFRDNFEQNYVDTIGATYTLSETVDFQDKNIRHFRLPDNLVSPFIFDKVSLQDSCQSIISPLGFHLDNDLVNNFLDIAVKNELITKERRDNIEGYEIYRGDTRLYRSVQSSGLMYDMKTARKEGEDYLFSNFPYNNHGADKLFNNVTPYVGENHNWTYHSPETDFRNPTLYPEISLQGYQYGYSKGHFNEVNDHAKWVILGNEARRLAGLLATLEAASEIAAIAMQGIEAYRAQAGATFSTNIPGMIIHAASALITGINIAVFGYGRYRYEWLNTFTNLGTPRNFAQYYASTGCYSSFLTDEVVEGDKLRGLSIKKYLKDGIFLTTDESTGVSHRINHLNRERTVLLSSSNNFPITYGNTYYNYDNNDVSPFNSSQPIASEDTYKIGLSNEFTRRIASPYVAMKKYIVDQYGTLNSINWIATEYRTCLSEDNVCDTILGGDTFIGRYALKRKIPIFREDAFQQADLAPFEYSNYYNVAEAKYYIDYRQETEVGGSFLPDIKNTIRTDCGDSTAGFYVKPPKKFYLYYYGIPSFLTETRINTNYRYAKPDLRDNFYPQNLDYMNWTQEKNVRLAEPNTFYYDYIYSNQGTSLGYSILPTYYSKDLYDKKSDNRNTVMWSIMDNSENSITDPWRVYRPLDSYTFPAEYGEITRLKGIENEQLLGVFSNTVRLYNAVDMFVSNREGRTSSSELGGLTVFNRNERSFFETDEVDFMAGQNFGGIYSTPFGHVIINTNFGNIFLINPGGKGVTEISRVNPGGKENGMYQWFKNYLPFNITKFFPNFKETENAYNGVGFAVTYDAYLKRVIITKKDYCPIDNTVTYDEELKEFTYQGAPYSIQEAITEGVLEDVSWTITYNPYLGGWESYMSYKPNYYVTHNNYFQSGVNQTTDDTEAGLWSHLLTNQSYQVFYGKKYPWRISYPSNKNEYLSQHLQDVYFFTEARRYHNQTDFSIDDRITFDKMWIHSDREHSGELNLIMNNGTMSMLTQYPKTSANNTTQDILVSHHQERYSVNHIYNRVKSNRNNVSLWNWDKNKIEKQVNQNAVSFYGKQPLEFLTSLNFLIDLEYNQDSRYDLEMKFGVTKTEIDDII